MRKRRPRQIPISEIRAKISDSTTPELAVRGASINKTVSGLPRTPNSETAFSLRIASFPRTASCALRLNSENAPIFRSFFAQRFAKTSTSSTVTAFPSQNKPSISIDGNPALPCRRQKASNSQKISIASIFMPISAARKPSSKYSDNQKRRRIQLRNHATTSIILRQSSDSSSTIRLGSGRMPDIAPTKSKTKRRRCFLGRSGRKSPIRRSPSARPLRCPKLILAGIRRLTSSQPNRLPLTDPILRR